MGKKKARDEQAESDSEKPAVNLVDALRQPRETADSVTGDDERHDVAHPQEEDTGGHKVRRMQTKRLLEVLEESLSEASDSATGDGQCYDVRLFQEDAEKLKALAASYLDAEVFSPGDIVVWKDGLRHRRYPSYGQPAIVMDFDPRNGEVDQQASSSSSYYRETLDMKLAICIQDANSERDFLIFHFDSRRFRKNIG